MMYIKLYEEYLIEHDGKYPAAQFQDDYMIVHKVTEGSNKGRIKFKFYDEDDKNYSNICSMIFGATKILDTKYIDNEQIREVKIGGIKFRKVPANTIDVVLNCFLEQMGYNPTTWRQNPEEHSDREQLIKILKEVFEYKIKNVALESKDLGDIFDNLLKVRDEIFEFQKEHYVEYDSKRMSKKYNVF